MGRITNAAVLALTVMLAVLSGHAATTSAIDAAASGTGDLVIATPSSDQGASVTLPDPEKAVVIPAGQTSNSRGYVPAAGEVVVRGDRAVRAELVDAYTLAVLLAPKSCHLSLSLLAAIGQVESGNLAGRAIDARNRVVPAVLGPVLDGTATAAIPDSDNGLWDGHKVWDRALGPMQLLPATWREVGLDADGDGVRDPQNVYDSAGAAMVYLCNGGRDLSTPDGLADAVWSYNHSRAYVRQVLAWKTAYDAADITGVSWDPNPGTWQVGPDPFAPSPQDDGAQALQLRTTSPTPTASQLPSPAATPSRTPSRSPSPAATRTSSTTPSTSPSTRPPSSAATDPSGTASAEPTCPTPSPSESPSATPTPTPTPAPTPAATPGASPSGDATADPADPCAPPTPPTPTESPASEASPPASPTGTPTAR